MKFHSIRIQNYKSINDITLYLSDVNLLIGPNNSGKSNILSALKLFSDYVYYLKYKRYPDGSKFKSEEDAFIREKNKYSFLPINFYFRLIDEDFKNYVLHIHIGKDIDLGYLLVSRIFCVSISEIENFLLNEIIEKSDYIETDGDLDKQSNDLFRSKNSILFGEDMATFNKSKQDFKDRVTTFKDSLFKEFANSSIYNIQVEKLKSPARLKTNEDSMLSDGSNLVSFIDSMRDTNPKVIREIEKDLFRFTKEFESIRLIKVTEHGANENSPTLKKLGLADKDDNTFWSDQLSEGVLYFLALLSIIHQPNPPRLLMLEEPEKGVHPRRIKEIIELIFQIAKEKNIRIILTTHSPYVVDEFAEVPEGVHIIDKVDKATQVKNLKLDFIDKEKDREDKIDYLSGLGEHWSIGFLGGVPE